MSAIASQLTSHFLAIWLQAL
uniref:Uncharacterized protein n=1 Tax=Anguilla anguilla TaxID=7936 RepID=A0A0E9PN03_ANGAN